MMTTTNSYSEIIILTQGGAGYVAALSLVNEIPQLAGKIRIVDKVSTNKSEWLDLCSSAFSFHTSLGVAEQEFVAATGARIKYGSQVQLPGKAAGFFSDAPFGAPLEGLKFFSLFIKYGQHHAGVKFRDYCLVAHLAAAGKCRLRGRQLDQLSDLVNCGYVVCAQKYTNYLRALCKHKNIACVTVENLQVQAADGVVQGLSGDGLPLTATHYLDCSDDGLLALAMGLSSAPVFETAQPIHAFTNCETEVNGAAVTSVGEFSVLAPQGLKHDWLVGSGLTKTYALAKPAGHESGEPLDNAALAQAWVGNCVFLGNAFARLPGFCVDALHRVRSGIFRLVNCWPSPDSCVAAAKVFNRRSAEELDCLAAMDNYILHRAFAQWVPLSPIIADKLAVFHALGQVPMREAETMSAETWQAFFHAFDEPVSDCDLLTQIASFTDFDEKLAGIQRFFASVTNKSASLSSVYAGSSESNSAR